MKAILYRDFICIKSQVKSFFWCFVVIFMPPVLITYRKFAILNNDTLFMIISAIVPICFGVEFMQKVLIEDRSNEMFPLIFRNGVSVLKYCLTKAIIPFFIGTLYTILSLIIYRLFFNSVMFSMYSPKDLVSLYFIYAVLTVVMLFICELLIFVIKTEVNYMQISLLLSIAIVGTVFYFTNPINNLLPFFLAMILLSLIIFLIMIILLKKKYAYVKTF